MFTAQKTRDTRIIKLYYRTGEFLFHRHMVWHFNQLKSFVRLRFCEKIVSRINYRMQNWLAKGKRAMVFCKK